MTILITGVAGLLGSRLAEWIKQQHPTALVVGVDDISGGVESNVPKWIVFYQRDIVQGLGDIFEQHKPDYVFHFAAYAAEGLSPFIRKYNYTNNLLATAEIVNNCINHNIKRLVFTSTMAVYGEGTPPFDESDPRRPIDPYGIAKSSCEMDIEVAGVQHNLDWCIIRPHNVYGRNQNIWDKYRNVLGIWMYQHLNGMPLSIFGDGEQKRAFSYIDDCLEPLWNAAVLPQASKQIINLGGIHECTINEACDTLIRVMGGGTKVYHEQRHEVKYAFPTYQKSIDILGYQQSHSLEQGLQKMWQWAKQQPMRPRFFWNDYEVERGLYSFWKSE